MSNKTHTYLFSFMYAKAPDVFANAAQVEHFEENYIDQKRILAAIDTAQKHTKASSVMLLSINYLGYMTKEEYNGTEEYVEVRPSQIKDEEFNRRRQELIAEMIATIGVEVNDLNVDVNTLIASIPAESYEGILANVNADFGVGATLDELLACDTVGNFVEKMVAAIITIDEDEELEDDDDVDEGDDEDPKEMIISIFEDHIDLDDDYSFTTETIFKNIEGFEQEKENITVDINDQFGVELEDSDWESAETIKDILKIIVKAANE